VKLFVEGGGNTAALKAECRKGFTTFITKAGISRRPKVIASGSRQNAYKDYCTAIRNGEQALLLVDSEDPISAAHEQGTIDDFKPWEHLKTRVGDGWSKPQNADDADCHLMTQVMESWFIADRDALKKFFGPDFNSNQLPSTATPIEKVSKDTLFSALRKATASLGSRRQYGKGKHSFKILAQIDPALVTKASPWAKRFIEKLK